MIWPLGDDNKNPL